ncbi:helix-turn-helix domain-containing protein [Dyella sp. 20L07]|uniref:helix-turn-helix domain-containing protein n=1 Tax=Dyella sp. 20L07 TaxID=3384240 RepID=UPI003D2DB04F
MTRHSADDDFDPSGSSAMARADQVQAHMLTSTSKSLSGMTATTYRRDVPSPDVVFSTKQSDAFLAVVNLRALAPFNRWCDGVFHHQSAGRREGDVTFLDLRREYVTDGPQPVRLASILIPQTCLDTLARDFRASPIRPLSPANAGFQADPLLHSLAKVIVAITEKPEPIDQLLADHIFQATRLHVATHYCAFVPPSTKTSANLSSRQMHRIKELMLDDLSANISVDDLAQACGLSSGHFIRSFRSVTGLTPHRWRTYQRIDKAKVMLALTDDAICNISMECGFSAQSHFTRIFVATTGLSPAAYRRLHRGRPHAGDR